MPLSAEQLTKITATPLTLGRHIIPRLANKPYIAHPWLRYLEQEVLTMLYRPGVEILIVSVPPQEGKSSFCSMLLPFWYLGRNPGHQVILVSYNEGQAGKWGMKVRDAVRMFGPALFDIGLNPSSDAVTDWKLTNGYGGMMSAGIRGGITGNPGDLILCDDTLKGAEERNSPTIKDKNFEEWNDAITTRFQENTKVIVPATRWVEDDLSGRLIEQAAQPGYSGFPVRVINIKALAEPDPDELRGMNEDELAEWVDPLGRRYGEGLQGQHSQRFFQIKKASTPIGSWMALHQGTPTASEGGMFPEGHWRYWVRDGEDREDGDVLLPEITVRVRVWDLASSEGDGDWTVGTLMGRSADGRFFVLDVQRFQHAPGGVLAKVKSTAVNDGYETHIIIEQSRSGDGAHVIDFYTKELPGYSVSPANAKGEKEVRATPYSVEQNKNNVYLWRHASYLGTWIKEHSQMDGKGKRPKHDDEIDTGAYGMKFLLGHGGSFIWDSSSIPPGWDSLTPEEQMELLAIRVAIGAA